MLKKLRYFECGATEWLFCAARIWFDYDYNENIGVAKMLARRKQLAEESANNDDCPHALNSYLIPLIRFTHAERGSKCLL